MLFTAAQSIQALDVAQALNRLIHVFAHHCILYSVGCSTTGGFRCQVSDFGRQKTEDRGQMTDVTNRKMKHPI
jgi:hypothetical protein